MNVLSSIFTTTALNLQLNNVNSCNQSLIELTTPSPSSLKWAYSLFNYINNKCYNVIASLTFVT